MFIKKILYFFLHIFKNTLLRHVLSIFFLAFSFFILISLISYHPFDPSLFSVTIPDQKIHNLGGSVGAYLSGLAFYYFGLTSFLLFPLLTIGTSLLFLLPEKSPFRLSFVLGSILFSLVIILLGQKLIPILTNQNIPIFGGGILGETMNEQVIYNLGKYGNIIFLVTSTILGIMLVFNLPIPIKKIKLNLSIPQRSEKSEITLPKLTTTPHKEKKIASNYLPPASHFFKKSNKKDYAQHSKAEYELVARQIEKTFLDFGVEGQVINFQPGPVVTVYEFQPNAGVKLTRVLSLVDDVALSLKVDAIFIHPIKGKQALGIEVPNTHREIVYLGDVIDSEEFHAEDSSLTIALGKSKSGEVMMSDLSTMPHLLAAGATGSGKSVAINTILCSLISKSSPKEVRLILVDPKMLELSVYEGIPHLLMPVITEPEKASLALRWAAEEMERRYRLMQHASVRHISAFNDFIRSASQEQLEKLKDAFLGNDIEPLPFIVLVIDELADLMLTAPKDVERSIQRLAQKARASGIHLVLATQRPSVDVITGVIKANLPCRIAFQVVSKHDSRTIIDQNGADKLLGKGDMLFQRPGTGRLERIHGAFVSDEEVNSMIAEIKRSNPSVTYDEKIMHWIDKEFERTRDTFQNLDASDLSFDQDDPKYDEAISIAKNLGHISASYLQRQLKIGYNRAARIVETMEKEGLVGKPDGVKPREWLGSI